MNAHPLLRSRFFTLSATAAFVLMAIALPAFAADKKKAGAESQSASQTSHKIDAILSTVQAEKGVTANPVAGDEIFVRRIFLDVIGRTPTLDETEVFLASSDSRKREKLIDELLDSEGYVSYFHNYWADILRLKTQLNGNGQSTPAGQAYAQWLKESLRDNKPYDEIVYEMLTASGKTWENGAVGYYIRDYGMPLDNLAITSQIFLGTQIVCAQCHNHPFDKWSQMDYFHMAAFTNGMVTSNQAPNAQEASEMFRKENKNPGDYQNVRRAASEILKPVRFTNVFETSRPVRLPHDYQYDDAKPKEVVEAKTPFGEDAIVLEGETPVHAFAAWTTSPDNPRFTTVVANRLWKSAFGLGLIEPVDEMTDETVAVMPELMTFLEDQMKSSGYDMKAYLRMIYNTKAYQRSASTEEVVAGEPYYFPGPVLRRMSAEQIWDSLVAMAVENPDAPNPEVELLAERNLLEVAWIGNAVYTQTPEDFLKGALDIAKLQRELSDELEEVQKELAAAREAKDQDRVRAASREASRIRRTLAVEVENRVYRKGLEDKATLVASNEKSSDASPATLKLVDEAIGNTPAEQDGAQEQDDNAMMMRQESRGIMNDVINALTAEESSALREAEKARRAEEMAAWGIDEKDERKTYQSFETIRDKLMRASDIQSPAPNGHFLREFGQSDREVVENANDQASITQALALLNGPVIGGLGNRYSVLARDIREVQSAEEKLEVIFLTMLSRKPDADERELLLPILEKGANQQAVGIIWSMLNTRQFLFIQ